MDHSAPATPRRSRAIRDRVIAAVARMLTRMFFTSVEVEGPGLPDGPIIMAASHLNGFVDPVVLVAKAGFLPRFLAKGTLWKITSARIALNFARVIPVHRRVDNAAGADNTSTFSSAIDALADGAALAIFPEGTTHDDTTIAPLRTGVARIALQAKAAGVTGLHIVPIGITYEDKVKVRGRALVSFGAPISIPNDPALLDANDEPHHELVRDLTEQTRRAITELTPNFADTDDALALSTAASVVHASPAADAVSLSRVTATARALGKADETRRAALVGLVARYVMLLASVRLHDQDIVRGVSPARLARQAVLLSVLVVVLSPFASAGLIMNAVPVLLVLVAGLLPKAPVSKGTIRVLVAAVVFPLTWLTFALSDAGTSAFADIARTATAPVELVLGSNVHDRAGVAAAVVVLVAAPLFGAVALYLVERVLALVATVVRWRTFVDRRGQLAVVRERRSEVVAMVNDMVNDMVHAP